MENAKLAWSLLSGSIGSYEGRGVNHEGQKFTGELKLEVIFPDKVLSLISSATGDEGEVYHTEFSLIGPDVSGALVLHVASNNHPAITPHFFNRVEENEGARSVIFRFGDPEKRDTFREEVTFTFHKDGSLVHHYSWGMPGGKFEPHSGSRMQRLSR